MNMYIRFAYLFAYVLYCGFLNIDMYIFDKVNLAPPPLTYLLTYLLRYVEI